MPGDDGATTVMAATVKLAPFYQHAPSFWFIRAESQFELLNISSDSTKFNHVVSALSEEVALRVMPGVESHSYDTLKTALLDAFDLTETQRADRLLHMPAMGDKLPSAYVSEILALVPSGKTPDYLERQIFMEQLPPAVRSSMAAHVTERDLRKLGKLADAYLVNLRSSASSSSFAVDQPPPPSAPQFSQCHHVAEDLASCSVGRRQPQHATNGKLCSLHNRYGASARGCRGGGCMWTGPDARLPARRGNANAGRR